MTADGDITAAMQALFAQAISIARLTKELPPSRRCAGSRLTPLPHDTEATVERLFATPPTVVSRIENALLQ